VARHGCETVRRRRPRRFGGLVNLNVHFHLLVPDGVFSPTADDGLAFALLPAPTGTDLLAILDRVIRRIARRIAEEAGDNDAAGAPDASPDLFAQIQAEAATTWRSPATTPPTSCAAPTASARGPGASRCTQVS